MPLVARILAFVLLASGIAFVGVSYYKLRNREKFVPSKKPAELSKDVTGIVERYEQRVTKTDGSYLLVRASRDITYSDSHHELENVSVAVYPPAGELHDQISAARAIYQPTTSIISFLGNVMVETKDKLKVKTEALSFDQNTEASQTDSPVVFEKENITGKSIGAVVEQKATKLELKKEVEIVVSPRAGVGNNAKPSPRSRPVTIKASHAAFDQGTQRLSFSGGVTAEQETSIMSGDTLDALLNQEKNFQKGELRGNSYLRTMEPGRAA